MVARDTARLRLKTAARFPTDGERYRIDDRERFAQLLSDGFENPNGFRVTSNASPSRCRDRSHRDDRIVNHGKGVTFDSDEVRAQSQLLFVNSPCDTQLEFSSVGVNLGHDW